MCFVAAIPIIIAAVGAYSQAQASDAAGDARSKMDQYQAAVAANNAKISETNAQYAIDKGGQQSQTRMMLKGQQEGTARATMAASGVRIDSGSPLNVQGDIAAIAEYDVSTIRNNALREAYGYRITGLGYSASSGLNSAEAGFDRQAGQLGVMTSLVSGAGSVSDKYSKARAAGAFNRSGSGSTTVGDPGGLTEIGDAGAS